MDISKLTDFFNPVVQATQNVRNVTQNVTTQVEQTKAEIREGIDEAKTAVITYAGATLLLNAISTAAIVVIAYQAVKKGRS